MPELSKDMIDSNEQTNNINKQKQNKPHLSFYYFIYIYIYIEQNHLKYMTWSL